MKVLIWTVDFEKRSAGPYLFREAQRQGFDVQITGSRNNPEEMLPILHAYKPDVVFAFPIKPTLPPYYRKIRKTGAKLVLWYPDMTETTRDRMWRQFIAGEADMLLFSILETAQRYRKLAPYVLWTPQYFDHRSCIDSLTGQLPVRLDPNKPIYNLCFIGSVDAQRRQWLRVLEKLYAPVYFSLDGIKNKTEVREFRMAEAYAQSKIAIGVQRSLFTNVGDYVTSNRIYNAMGSGAFYLSHPVTRLDLAFQNGCHCVMHNDKLENACQLIDYYLQDDKARESIARKGRRQVLRYHTLEQRVKEYWQVMQALVAGTMPKQIAFGDWSDAWNGQPHMVSSPATPATPISERVITRICACSACVASSIQWCPSCGRKMD